MSHTSHPYAIRLGIIRTWKSRWFSTREYRKLFREDISVREFLDTRLRGMFVDSVEIERSPGNMELIIKTVRPGLLIGRGGEGIEKLRGEVISVLKKAGALSTALKITVEEIKSPEMHARVMVEQIGQDLERRLPFRRVIKKNLAKMSGTRGVLGAKIMLAGRLDGSEMARREWLKDGQIPLQTLRADIDFARGRASLPYGDIGIKVWIYRGEIFNKDKDKKPNHVIS